MTETAISPRPRRFARNPKAEAIAPSAGTKATDLGASLAPSKDEAPKPASKIAQVIALLKREQGATLAELVAVTGWQPHTTRAALTGLRKKNHPIERTKRGDETCYRLAAEACA